MITETLKEFADWAKRYDAVSVAYSDGKDSRCVMDMAVRSFKRVEAFFMYFVPGLECVETGLAEAEKRWGVKIRQYPHWVVSRLLAEGIYCHPKSAYDKIPKIMVRQVYALAVKDANTPVVLTGAKKADSPWRRQTMVSSKEWWILTPLARWNKYDVLSYLKSRNIPVPSSSGGNFSGVGLGERDLLWLYDTYPKDYERVRDFFPFIDAVVWRRTFHGSSYDQQKKKRGSSGGN